MIKEITKEDVYRIAYEEIDGMISNFYETDDDHFYHFFKGVESIIRISNRIIKQTEVDE